MPAAPYEQCKKLVGWKAGAGGPTGR